MPDINITGLTNYADPKSTDVLPVVDVTADVTKKVTVDKILKNATPGTAADPGITFDGRATNTGIYSPADYQVGISTNGVCRIFCRENGNVGINNANPAFPFDVTGNTSITGTLTASSFIPSSSTAPASGLYLAAANTPAISANSTEYFRVTSTGVIVTSQPTPAAVDASATLTVANLTSGIITSTTAAAVTMTLPTGTLMDGGFSPLYTNLSFNWSVINTGATNSVTVQGGTGHTVVGSGTVAASNSGLFRSRRTGATTWVTYRVSS